MPDPKSAMQRYSQCPCCGTESVLVPANWRWPDTDKEAGMKLSDKDQALVLRALDDAAWYRLGDEAANADEIEEDEDRELYLAYLDLEERLTEPE